MKHVAGPDSRKWREVPYAARCHACGSLPIAARTGVGWNLQCPTDLAHGGSFEQWLGKCVRRWDYFHKPNKKMNQRLTDDD